MSEKARGRPRGGSRGNLRGDRSRAAESVRKQSARAEHKSAQVYIMISMSRLLSFKITFRFVASAACQSRTGDDGQQHGRPSTSIYS